jgi:hypothetical protein
MGELFKVVIVVAGDDELFDLGKSDLGVVVVKGQDGDLILVAEAVEGLVQSLGVDTKVTAVYIEVVALLVLEQVVLDDTGLTAEGDTCQLVGDICFELITSFRIVGRVEVLLIKLF